MIQSTDVVFRNIEVPIVTPDPNDDDKRMMDVIEISYPDGKVVAFPADDKSPETGRRYREMYQEKFDAFKNGQPDPDRVARLEQEIADRQTELDGLHNPKAPDDRRVQENLGYGEIKPDENPHDATRRLPGEGANPVAALGAKPEDENVNNQGEQHEPFDHMTKAELSDWIGKNSSETAPADANKTELVNLARKIERKNKANV